MDIKMLFHHEKSASTAFEYGIKPIKRKNT